MMRYQITLILCLCLLAACTPAATETPPTTTPVPSCGDWLVSMELFTCIVTDEGLLIQSPGIEQMTLRAYEASIVIYGTIFIEENDELRIAVLEGDAVIGSRGQNRVISVGHAVNLSISDDRADFPSEISLTTSLPDLALEELPRSIDENAIIIRPTTVPTTIPTVEADNCVAPQNWKGRYTVVSGDTLARIANNYEITVAELAEENCLSNVSRITVGQELIVPGDNETDTMAISIAFRADSYSIEAGQCTNLRWDASGALEIYLDDNPVNADSFQEVCPEETTSYILRVIVSDEEEESRELTVSLRE